MSTKRQIVESSGIYFITITCYEWLPLFELTNRYDIVYKWFDYLKQQGHFITGYVPIAIGMGNGKRFMAYEIVKRLELAGEKVTLNKLMEGVTSRDHKRGKLHEVFQSSFDWKECRSNKFISQN